jgi:hypothetical protein
MRVSFLFVSSHSWLINTKAFTQMTERAYTKCAMAESTSPACADYE